MPPAKHLISRDELIRPRMGKIDAFFRKNDEEYLEKNPPWELVKVGEETESFPVVNCSSIGSCVRQQGYRILQAEADSPAPAVQRMKMFDGQYHENIVKEWLRLMGYKITDEQKELKRKLKVKGKLVGFIRGHIDGIIHGIEPLPEWMARTNGKPYSSIWENKGLTSYKFKESERKGRDPSILAMPHYRDQAMLYMHLSGLRTTLFTIKNKDSAEIRPIEWFYSPEKSRDLMIRATKVAITAGRSKLLPREHSKSSWQCSYCEFKKRCWKEK